MQRSLKKSVGKVVMGGAMLFTLASVASAGTTSLYALGGSGSLRSYTVDPATGVLTYADQEILWGADTQQPTSAASLDGSLIYVVLPDLSQGMISQFKVDSSNGKLIEAPVSPYVFPAQITAASRMVVHPNKRFAYSVAAGGEIRQYLVDATTAGLTPTGNPVTSGSFAVPHITQNGKFLYTANSHVIGDATNIDKVSAFSINASGTLTPINNGTAFPTCTGPRNLTSDPSGTFLIVSCLNSRKLQVHRIETNGALTRVGNGIDAEGSPGTVSVGANGKFVYVSYGSPAIVRVLSLSTSGTLTDPKDTTLPGPAAFSALDRGNAFLFVGLTIDNQKKVSAYPINKSNGQLGAPTNPFVVLPGGFLAGMEITSTP